MPGNRCLLTALFIVCYFIGKGRNDVVYTAITRDPAGDYFTNVCKNCVKYGATTDGDFCKCNSSGSVFLRFEKRCKSQNEFRSLEGNQCLFWQTYGAIRVIDTERTDLKYVFLKSAGYKSCQVEQSISYLNSTTGKWEVFNLTGDILEVQNDPNHPLLATFKVTQQSPNLTIFKGYIMKVGLECIPKYGSKRVKECLLFKAEGELLFPLCNLPPTTPPPTTLPTTTPMTTTPRTTTPMTTTPRTTIPMTTTPRTTTPMTTTPRTTTGTPTSITTTSQPPPNGDNSAIIAAIVTIGTVLCLSLICAFVFVLYRYTNIFKPRRQTRNPGTDFNVISNPGQQTYRIQEEPLYAEVRDIYLSDKINTGDPTKKVEEKPSVLLNPYVNEAAFSRGRPLPSRPEIEESVRTRSAAAAPVYQNGGHEAVDEETDGSIVFMNRKIEETSFTASPTLENNFNKLPETQEQDEESTFHDHHHGCHNDTVCPDSAEGTEEDLVYQGLVKGKRAQSVFVCPSCNDNPDYQRLSTPRNCPHGEKDKTKEKRASFYESLAGLERGSRESVYARPSPIAEVSAIEDEENRNGEEGEGLPEYHILEPEESVSNQDPDEPVDHDYNILEEPETACDEVDEQINDRIHDPGPTNEDPGLPLESSEILNIEDNPADAKPWDSKEDPHLPLEPSEIVNIEDNPAYAKPSEIVNIEDNSAYAKPWDTKEDPELALEPSEFLIIEDNPAYAKPWKTNTVEPSVRRRAYSM